jgi:hypothetical protein
MSENTDYNTIKDCLGLFESISLAEMDGVQLMDRTDVKYVMPFDKLRSMLESLSEHYRVLTISGNRIFSYSTDYFDTPALDMFFDHHNGKLNRFKIRYRNYFESSLDFLEVKFKSNKGRVIKERIRSTPDDRSAFIGFVTQHTPYNPGELNRIINNNFNRFTLVDKQLRERVTVDFNLSFSDNSQRLHLNGLVIVEVKQNRRNTHSQILHVLKSNAIRPASVSKYCLGVALLNNSPKHNNFKKTIIMINKISHVELSA